MWKQPTFTPSWLLLHVIAGASLAGCYNPSVKQGLDCTDNNNCPIGQTCNLTLGECYSPGQAPDPGQRADASLSNPDPASCPGTRTFVVTGAIEMFSIPTCANVVTIEAFGAQGGGAAGDATEAGTGGMGAHMKGEFTNLGGETIQIVVGAKGKRGVTGAAEELFPQGGGTGGGGSFVANNSNQPLLIVAGGGGAAYDNFNSSPGGPGQITEYAQRGGGLDGGSGGLDAILSPEYDGGDTYDSALDPDERRHGGAGGGGFNEDGRYDANGDQGLFGSPNGPGKSFINKGFGGLPGSGRSGGFGGGGAAGFSGGGGGGYSGGGGGGYSINNTDHSGGGGGSFNGGAVLTALPGAHSGDGKVIINWKE